MTNANDVFIFKLLTGEEIIAEVLEDDTEARKRTLAFPLELIMTGTQANGIGVHLQPYMAFNIKENLVLGYEGILFKYKPSQSLLNSYVSSKTQMETNLIVPGAQQLIKG